MKVSEAAAAPIRSATAAQPNMALRLQIDAVWNHGLSLSPPKPGAVEVDADGISLRMDPWSAARADGLSIHLEEQLGGTRFVFENPNAPPPVGQMSVQTLQEKRDRGEAMMLFDVRGEDERAQALIEFARALDHDAMKLLETLPRGTEIIFHCHLGGRSQQAAEHYRRLGYPTCTTWWVASAPGPKKLTRAYRCTDTHAGDSRLAEGPGQSRGAGRLASRPARAYLVTSAREPDRRGE